MGDFYTRFNKELSGIDQVITGGETIHAFVTVLGPRGSALHDSLSVIPVNTIDEMVAQVKSYIDLEIAKEGREPYMEVSKKEIQEAISQSNALPRWYIKITSVTHLSSAPIEKFMKLSHP